MMYLFCVVLLLILCVKWVYIQVVLYFLLCIVDESIDGKLFHLSVYMRYLGGYKKNRAATGICSVECW